MNLREKLKLLYVHYHDVHGHQTWQGSDLVSGQFPDGHFTYGQIPDGHFPDQTLPRPDIFPTRHFPDGHFPDGHFPDQTHP